MQVQSIDFLNKSFASLILQMVANNRQKMQLIALLLLLAFGSFLWCYVTQERQETARKLYYNRLAMPILLLPDSPFDEDFPERIKRLQESLNESGNTYRPRIIATPYYAPIGDMQTINKSFDMYCLLQVQAWLEAREEVAAGAFKNAPPEAFEVIAGNKNFSLSK
jgi:hypothetical protein